MTMAAIPVSAAAMGTLTTARKATAHSVARHGGSTFQTNRFSMA
jgi:IMP dehydrogenase/GMP reductase